MPSEPGTTQSTSAEAAATAIRRMQAPSAPCWGCPGERRAGEMARCTGPPACLEQRACLSGHLQPCISLRATVCSMRALWVGLLSGR